MSKTHENQIKEGAFDPVVRDDSAEEIARINTELADLKSRLAKAESELEEKKKEWQTVKARRLDSRYLAWIAIGLYLFTGAGFIVLAGYFLSSDRTWVQAIGVLGLCLLWIALAVLSMRLLSDRCK